MSKLKAIFLSVALPAIGLYYAFGFVTMGVEKYQHHFGYANVLVFLVGGIFGSIELYKFLRGRK